MCENTIIRTVKIIIGGENFIENSLDRMNILWNLQQR